MVHVTSPRLFQGQFSIRGLALATSNLSIKLKPNSTLYEDTTGDTKYRHWGGLGHLFLVFSSLVKCNIKTRAVDRQPRGV